MKHHVSIPMAPPRGQKEAQTDTRQDDTANAPKTMILTAKVKTIHPNNHITNRSQKSTKIKVNAIGAMMVMCAIIASMAGCQIARDVAAGAAMPVQTAAATATPAPVPMQEITASAPITSTAPIIHMEEITPPRLGATDIIVDDSQPSPTEEEREALRQHMHTHYLPTMDASDIPVTFARRCNADEFVRIDPDMPDWLYFDIPYNMYGGNSGLFLSPRDTIAVYGAAQCGDYAKAAMCYVRHATDFRGMDQDIESWDNIYWASTLFADAYKNALIEERKAYYMEHNLTQYGAATTDYSLVYRDGCGHITVRVISESKTIDADDEYRAGSGLFSEAYNRWIYTAYDVRLDYDDAGKVEYATMQPLMTAFLVENDDRIAFLDEYMGQ